MQSATRSHVMLAAACLSASAIVQPSPLHAQCRIDSENIIDSGILAAPSTQIDALASSADGGIIALSAQEYSVPFRGSGAVYIFERDSRGGIELTQTILNPAPRFGSKFGFAVDLSAEGQTLVVGQPLDDDAGNRAGAIHIYERSGAEFVSTRKLTASDAVPEDFFGYEVAISADGSTVLAAAVDKHTTVSDAGVVYEFIRSGNEWIERDQIALTDPEQNDRFGVTMDISADGRRAVIGGFVPFAFMFDRTGDDWVETARIRSEDPAFLPYKVALSDDGRTMFVGSPGETVDDRILAGAAYAYFNPNANDWVQEARFTHPLSFVEAPFGFDLEVSGNGDRAVLPFSMFSIDLPGELIIVERVGQTWEEVQIIRPDAQENIRAFAQRAIVASESPVFSILSSLGNFQDHQLDVYTFDEFCDLKLATPIPGDSGRKNRLTTVSTRPGERIHFVWALAPGSTLIPGCGGLDVSLANPKRLGSAIVDANGEASIDFFVPRSASGLKVLFQTVDLRNCLRSLRIQHVFQ